MHSNRQKAELEETIKHENDIMRAVLSGGRVKINSEISLSFKDVLESIDDDKLLKSKHDSLLLRMRTELVDVQITQLQDKAAAKLAERYGKLRYRYYKSGGKL